MGFKAKLYLHQVRTRKLMGFKNQAVPTPGSNSGLRKKFARFRPERHFPRSAGWEGREVLVVIRTVCSQLMGFAKTCMTMTQPGFEPATFAFQTAAKTARLRKLLLQTRAAISGYIPSMTQWPIFFRNCLFLLENPMGPHATISHAQLSSPGGPRIPTSPSRISAPCKTRDCQLASARPRVRQPARASARPAGFERGTRGQHASEHRMFCVACW